MRQHLAASSLHGLLNSRVSGIGDALISLTMVISTYIEYRVVLTVIPTDYLVVLLYKREETVCPVLQLCPFLHLSKQPRT